MDEKASKRRLLVHRLKLIALWPSAILLSLAVFALVLSIVSYYVLLYPPLQQRIIRIAEEKLSAYIVGDVTIERFESNLLSYVDLYGVRAYGRSEYRDSAYVRQATVRYSIFALARKRVRVTSAQITDVRGHVVMEEGNNIMLPFMPLHLVDSAFHLISDSEERKMTSDHIPNPDNWAWKVILGRVQVNGINGVYRDLANGMVGEIVNATATARFHAIDSFSVRLRVPEGSYRSPWWDGEIDTIGAAAVITWKRLYVKSLLFKGSGTHVTAGEGVLSYFPDGPWDLKADFITSIRPAPILYEFTPTVGRDGFLEGTASFGGRLYEPIYNAHVKGYGIVYDGYRIDDFSVNATFGRDEYGRARIRGASELGQFDVSASLLMKDLMTGVDFGDYSVSAVLTGLDTRKIAEYLKFDLPFPVDRGNLRFGAVGRCFEIPTAFDAVATGFEGDRLPGGAIDASAAVKGENWVLNGSWGVNRVEGMGRVNTANGALSGYLRADVLDPSVASAFVNERVRGRIVVAADVDGRLDDMANFSVSASVSGEAIAWRGMHADSIEAQLALDGGKLRLHRADGHISGRIDSLAALLGQGAAGGYINADFSVSGDLDSMVANGSFDGMVMNALVHARQLRYGEYTLDTLYTFASMENGALHWNNLYLREKGTSLESHGRLTLGADMGISVAAELFNEQGEMKTAAGKLDVSGTMGSDSSISAKYRVSSVPLDLFDPWIPEEHRMKGVVSLTGEFSGTAANPAARVNFRLDGPGYSDYAAHMVTGDAALSDSLVTGAAQLMLSEKTAAVKLKAALPFLPSAGWQIDETGSRAAVVSARADKLEISDVSVLNRYLEPDVRITGAASFNAEVANRGDGWRVGGKIAVPNGAVRYEPLDITVVGVKLNADLGGTLENPIADFVATSGRADMPPLWLDRSFVRGRTGLDTLVIDSARFVFRDGDNGFVDMRAQMLYSEAVPPDSFFYGQNLYAQYKIRNLQTRVFSRLVEGASLRNGLLNGSGVIYGGACGRPLVDGTLSLSGLDVLINDINPTLGPINAELKLSDSTISVTSMTARWGRGALSGSGRLFWDAEKFHDVNLYVRGSDLFFELPEVIDVGIENADLHISDHNGGVLLNGKVKLGPTSYVRDIKFLELYNQAQIGSDIRRTPNEFMQAIHLHIDLDLANSMAVDINLGSLTMDGRLTVGGTADDPSFMGRITIDDGYIYYLDRKFSIIEGTLFNPDLTAINPTLKIISQLEVFTYSPTSKTEQFTITLSLTGELENPVVRFSAEPALSELDILSILTFGERMGGMGSDFWNRGTNILANMALGIGARSLEKYLPIDRVSISGDVTRAGGNKKDGVRIGITKRFTSRFNVTVEANTGALTNQKATAQYRLFPNLYLEGQATSEGESAVNLNFRYSK